MAGLDSAIASLLASRTELLLSAIRPASSSTAGATTAQANSSALFTVDTPAVPLAPLLPANLPAASTQTLLSSVARTLDAISRFGGSATPPLMGDTPLWPTAPRPVSAFASVSESMFATRAAAAANGVAAPAPPMPAAVLASTLARTVDQSGLFYESHLVQWLAGQRPLSALSNEPQAQAGLADFDPPLPVPNASWDSDPQPAAVFSASRADPLNPARAIQTPQTPQQAAALAATVRDVQANGFTSMANPHGAAPASAAPNPPPQDLAVRASIAAGVDPSTIPLVRQQLDLFATHQFRWSGEAWPGAKFDWEIEPDHRDSGGAATDAERAWRTRVTLALPTLGNVDADLMLIGDQLMVRLNASGQGAIRLSADSNSFREHLEASGLKLQGLTVRATDVIDDVLDDAITLVPPAGSAR